MAAFWLFLIVIRKTNMFNLKIKKAFFNIFLSIFKKNQFWQQLCIACQCFFILEISLLPGSINASTHLSSVYMLPPREFQGTEKRLCVIFQKSLKICPQECLTLLIVLILGHLRLEWKQLPSPCCTLSHPFPLTF